MFYPGIFVGGEAGKLGWGEAGNLGGRLRSLGGNLEGEAGKLGGEVDKFGGRSLEFMRIS